MVKPVDAMVIKVGYPHLPHGLTMVALAKAVCTKHDNVCHGQCTACFGDYYRNY